MTRAQSLRADLILNWTQDGWNAATVEDFTRDVDTLVGVAVGEAKAGMEAAIRELAKDEPWDLCAFEKAADVIREWGQ